MSRVIALDVGDVRVGVAVSDERRTIAQPLEVYRRVGYTPDCAYVKQLCDRYETTQIVMGLPLNMDGSQGGQAKKIMDFAQILINAGLTIHYQDERMTTITAENVLISGGVRRSDRKQYVDKLAAAVILEQWLAQNA